MEEEIEVAIIDHLEEIPTSDVARSTKTLSTIRECDSSSVSRVSNHVEGDVKNFRNVESYLPCFPLSQRKLNSFGTSNPPIDIDLLLRYYACNSNMEESIQKVLKKAEENDFNRSIDPLHDQASKDEDQGPLVELRAIHNILESLGPSSSEDAPLITFRVRDVLTKIQSAIGRCGDKQLEQILSRDQSIRMCDHCGVISCSNTGNYRIEQRQSLPRTSYFLNTQVFSNSAGNDDGSKMNREADKVRKKLATKRAQKSNYDKLTFRKYRDGKKDYNTSERNFSYKEGKSKGSDGGKKIETMIAEREDEGNLERNRTKIGDEINSLTVMLSQVSDSQMANLPVFNDRKLKTLKSDEIRSNSGMTLETEINFNDKDPDSIKNHVSNFVNVLRSFNQDNSKDTGEMKNVASGNKENNELQKESYQGNINVRDETILNDILYVKSKFDDSRTHIDAPLKTRQDDRNKQRQSSYTPNNIASIIDALTSLARGRLKSVDAKRKDFVSQFDKRSTVQSRYSNNKHSFVLHASRDNPQLDFGSTVRDGLKYINGIPDDRGGKIFTDRSRAYSEQWRYFERNNGSSSATCLMEEDSLENCAKDSKVRYDPSETTTFSSSSAENMIREWMKNSYDEIGTVDGAGERSVSVKPLLDGSSATHQAPETEEKSVYCSETSIDRQCGALIDRYKMRHTKLLNGRPRNQSAPYILDNSKLHNTLELLNQRVTSNSKKIERFFSKQLFKPVKSIKSIKSMKFQEEVLNIHFPTVSENSSLDDPLKNITRRITYNEPSFGTTISDGKVQSILCLYRKMLEDSKQMDWESFQRFVADLHPSKRHVWLDICKSINDEAMKMASRGEGVTEVSIEISSIPCDETKKEEGASTCDTEIVFEMDMALEDFEEFLNREIASTEKGQLDILKRANKVIEDKNDDVCGIKVDFDLAG